MAYEWADSDVRVVDDIWLYEALDGPGVNVSDAMDEMFKEYVKAEAGDVGAEVEMVFYLVQTPKGAKK
jgi:hypothetical protein